jgi:hypothetical protein
MYTTINIYWQALLIPAEAENPAAPTRRIPGCVLLPPYRSPTGVLLPPYSACTRLLLAKTPVFPAKMKKTVAKESICRRLALISDNKRSATLYSMPPFAPAPATGRACARPPVAHPARHNTRLHAPPLPKLTRVVRRNRRRKALTGSRLRRCTARRTTRATCGGGA